MVNFSCVKGTCTGKYKKPCTPYRPILRKSENMEVGFLIDLQLQTFDPQAVLPVLRYGAEIWGPDIMIYQKNYT